MEFSASTPIYLQVVEEIKRMLMSGELKPGDKLWSARDMAVRYKINPNTAARVYKELELQQLCFTKRGLGTYLTEEEGIAEKLKKEKAEQLLGAFVRSFLGLGYTREEIQQFLNKALSEWSDEK
ncbi:MAG: GntR family transcriptional regulator [Lachnospiraceae bacterium]|nr:GntR family transcriptional regulator [Lachnospiraceae bacterium]